MLNQLLFSYLIIYLTLIQVNAKGKERKERDSPEPLRKTRRKLKAVYQDEASSSSQNIASSSRKRQIDLNEYPIDLNEFPVDIDETTNKNTDQIQEENELTNIKLTLKLQVQSTPNQTSSGLRPGTHSFIRVEGKYDEVKKKCKTHYKRFRFSKNTVNKCETCDEFLCALCHQIEHGLPSLPVVVTPKPDQICSFCNRTLGRIEEIIVEHTGSCQRIPHDKQLSYACYKPREECNFESNNKNNMRYHVRKHTGRRPFKCDHCGQGFVCLRNRNDHIIKIHQQKRIPRNLK